MPAPGGGASYGSGGNAVLQFAIQQLGTPYRRGSAGQGGYWDCSGLTLKAMAQAGVKLPHKAALQQELGYEVGLGGAQPGDLVFFSGGPTAVTNKNGLYIGHVGIYVGNGMVLEAFSSQDKTRIRPIGNRASKVVSVKRYTAPSTAPIVVPPSPWNGMHGGPGGQVSYVIPAGQGGAYGPVKPGGYGPQPTQSGQAPTGATWDGSKSTLTPDQIAQVAYSAGFRGDDLTMMVAIALGESGGNTGALNPNGKDQSYGLWQINMYGSMGPARQAQWGLTSYEDLYDPLTNARAAFSLFQSGGFKPWTVFTRGIYKQHMPAAQAGVAAATANGTLTQPFASDGAAGGTGMTYIDPSWGVGVPSEQDPAELAKQLFGASAMLLNDPEVGPIIRDAAAQGWSAARIQAAIEQTTWWKTTSGAARQWDAAYESDRASGDAQIQAEMTSINDLAQSMGLDLVAVERAGRGNLTMHLAVQALRLGWTDAQLRDAIAAEVLRDPELVKQLDEGRAGRQVRDAAYEYATPLSDAAAGKWAAQIATGQQTIEDYQAWLVGQAKATYGHLAADLDRGSTVRQMADPYLQDAADLLGVDPEQMDLADAKWNAALLYTDPKTGERRMPTRDEWKLILRSQDQYGYGNTEAANNKNDQLKMALGGRFGQVAA